MSPSTLTRRIRPLIAAMVVVAVLALAGGILFAARPTVAQTVGALDHVTITPASASLQLQAQQQFSAQAFDASNNPITGLSLTWSMVNGGGTISAGGLFTAGTVAGSFANTVKVSVIEGAISKNATVSVTIVPGAFDHIAVTPATLTLGKGDTHQFAAQAMDASNNVLPISSFGWSVVNGGGTISATGLFTAGQALGSFANTVQTSATVGSISKTATASVTVASAPPLPQSSSAATRAFFNGLLHKVGFDQFMDMQARFLDKDGHMVTMTAVAGKVTAITDTSLSIMPNGGAAAQTFAIVADTRFIPEKKRPAINDRVVVVTSNGALALVAEFQPSDRNKDDDDDDKDDKKAEKRMDQELDKLAKKVEQLSNEIDRLRSRLANLQADNSHQASASFTHPGRVKKAEKHDDRDHNDGDHDD